MGFDTETTGVDPHECRLVTAALVWRGPRTPGQAREQRVRTWLADPGVEIPEQAAAVHGITTQMAREQGAPITQVLEEVSGYLVNAMASQVPIVAYNAAYDLTLMEAELARHGLATMEERLGRPLGPVIDPLVMDRAVDRFRKGKRRLCDLLEVYSITMPEGLHTADVDVQATLDVLDAMVDAFPTLQELSREQLMPWQAQAHRDWAESFNAWLASRNPEREGASLDWPVTCAPRRPGSQSRM